MSDQAVVHRQRLAQRIAFLETDISAQTADEEAARVSALQKAWSEYGPTDELVEDKIRRRAEEVAQAQREGDFDR